MEMHGEALSRFHDGMDKEWYCKLHTSIPPNHFAREINCELEISSFNLSSQSIGFCTITANNFSYITLLETLATTTTVLMTP